jgi:CheY-like chemotaxis protein
MQKHSAFTPIHTILIPLIHEGPGINALEVARHFDAEIILVGVVVVPADQSLSVGAVAARALRKQLRLLGKDERITSKTQIIVSYQPWNELSNLLQKEKPDLIILDLMMPGMDGFDLLSDMKKQTELANIPVIMLTANATDESEKRAKSMGVKAFLTKPAGIKEITEIVKEVLCYS